MHSVQQRKIKEWCQCILIMFQYCNLIFGGWDYCIENNKAASIKKKAIYNELCNHLETERYNEEKEQRTKKER